jgi:SSS family solute:Na+ symporter
MNACFPPALLFAGAPRAQALLNMHAVDFAIIAVYFAVVLGIGFYLKRYAKTGEGFFMAGRDITAWVAGLSFICANLGALELMGWAAATYQYGILAAHYYWWGAIPAMLFLGVVMMPFYYICKTHSVPGYLQLRFGEPTRLVGALSFICMTILMSGINMYSMAVVLKLMLGWDIHLSIWISSLTVGIYVALGGLVSAIFNEVLQFFLIWLGALLIPILGMVEAGGWSRLVARIHANFPQCDYTHLWRPTAHFASNPMGAHWTGIVFGLMIGSLGYWTTDFLVVQRAIAARDLRSAKLAPIIGSFFKMAVPLIVILPGLLALGLLPFHLVPEEVALRTGQHGYNEVLPLMLARYCGPGLLGLGITALIAGFMSGMAGNVSAFATVWTYDFYRPFLRKSATDAHYVSMGRWCTILGVVVSIGTAYLVMQFASIMDYAQVVFSFFMTPIFSTIILGMTWKRATHAGGFWGLLVGTLASFGMWLMEKIDPSKIVWVAFSIHAKTLAENQFRLLWSGIIAALVTVVVSLCTRPKPAEELKGIVWGCTDIPSEGHLPLVKRPIFWAAVSFAIFALLQWIFW